MMSFSKNRSTRGVTTTTKLGLHLFHEGQDSIIDIVAVHGLNGHSESTWTAGNDKLWLRDFLPQSIPDARIFTWGYDAATHNTEHKSTLHLHDHGQALVNDLAQKRRGDMKRPIIFIAHSLGGLVVKAALIHSFHKRRDDTEHFSIKLSTMGIVFMGTPHLGSDAADMATVVLNALSVFMRTDTKMLDHLKQESSQLDLQRSQFAELKDGIRILYCFESLETHTLMNKTKLIVPKRSAVIQDGTAEELSIRADHRGMVRFLDEGDSAYASLVDRIRIWKQDKDGLMKRNWPEEPRSAIFQKAIEQESPKELVVLFFFFSDTQDVKNLLCSVNGMLRSILCQLIDRMGNENIPEQFAMIAKNEWNTEQLESAIATCIKHFNEQGNEVRIFLDGLNLCGQVGASTILRFLEKLVRGNTSDIGQRIGQNLKVFFSSQENQDHYKLFIPGIQSIIVEDHNQEDLCSFVQDRLATITPTAFRKCLQRLILKRAAGIFLWVLLIIQDVESHLMEGSGENEIFQHISQASVKDLSDIYEKRVMALKDDQKKETALVFQLMAFGKRPFTLLQMRHVFALSVTSGSPKVGYEDALKAIPRGESFQHKLRTILLGLAEFRSLQSNSLAEQSISVVFIHHTVRDYLLKDGLALLNADLALDMRAKSHLRILQLCLQIMDLDNDLSDENSILSPFQTYVGYFWMQHAKESDSLLGDEIKSPISLRRCTEKTEQLVRLYKEGRKTRFAANDLFMEDEDNFLVILAAEGCSYFVLMHTNKCRKCVPRNTQPIEDNTISILDRALFFATIHRQVKTVSAFRRLDSYKVDPNRIIHRSNATYKACYLGCLEIVKELLTLGADVLKKVPSGYRTGLHAAVACNHTHVVEEVFKHYDSDEDAQKILTHGVKFESEYGFNILHMAARFDRKDVAKVILERIEEMPDPEVIQEIETVGKASAIDIARKHNSKVVLNVLHEYM
ncbi:hypothetical protein E8E14_002825 [Neopestalotiopsis sp. 37M]|nr:hypothetical protein E8E14_002825 [Neopestalotiopsis sp. 37M]